MKHTVDIDAIHASKAELVAATALVAGHLAQFFGEPDAKYLTPAGEVRVGYYSAQEMNRIRPLLTAVGIPIVD